MANNQYFDTAYGLGQAILNVAPRPIVSVRNPSTSDRAQFGQIWVNNATGTVYILSRIVGNSYSWFATAQAAASLTIAGAISAGTTLTIGGLSSLNGGAAIVGGVTVTSGGAAITGNSTIVGTLGVTGVTTFTGASHVVGAMDATTTITAGTGLRATTGGLTVTAGGALVSAGNIVATLGNVVASAGNITATLGNLTLGAGLLALPTTSSTGGQVTINGNRWIHAYGTGNTFVGQASGNFTLTTATAVSNTALGNASLPALTVGTLNVALGDTSGNLLTTGINNVFVGQSSASVLVTGSNNTLVGFGTGTNYTTSETSNILIGSTIAGTTSENYTLRLGNGTGNATPGQLNAAYISGIYGKTVAATAGLTVIDNANKVGSLSGAANTFLVGGTAPSFSASPTASGTITAGTGLTATTGNITATAGNVVLSTAASYIALPGPIKIMTGAGAPGNGLAAETGDLYINTSASTTTTRLYIATGAGAWTYLTTNA